MIPITKEGIHTFKWGLWEKIGYEPNDGGQRVFHESPARFKGLFAGSRFGKSFCAAMEALSYLFIPYSRGWIVAPTYSLGEKEFRYLWDVLIIKLKLKVKRKSDDPRNGRMMIETLWGATVEVKSAEKPEGLLGEELDWLIMSEAAQLKKDVWERYLRQRVSTRLGNVIVPTTPKGYNWIYEAFYLPGQNSAQTDFWSGIYSVEENIYFPKEEIERAKKTLPKEVFEEQYLGRFVRFSGLIYPDFSELEHICSFQKIEGVWIVAIDPGVRVTGVLWACWTKDKLYIIDELYEKNVVVEEISRLILQKNKVIGQEMGYKEELPIFMYLIDPKSAQSRSIETSRKIITAYQEHGIFPCLAKNDVTLGINNVTSLLRNRQILVFDRCQNFRWEISQYEWSDIREGEDDKAKPLKKKDHLMDSLKYIVLSTGWYALSDDDEDGVLPASSKGLTVREL